MDSMTEEKATEEEIAAVVEAISNQILTIQAQTLDSMAVNPILSSNDKLNLALSMMAMLIEPFIRNGALETVLYTIDVVGRKVKAEQCTKPIIYPN